MSDPETIIRCSTTSLPPLEYFSKCIDIKVPEDIGVNEFIKLSDDFTYSFPVHANRTKTLLTKNKYSAEDLHRHINDTYPLVHEKVLFLMCEFLEYKKKYGSDIEQALYSQMDLVSFVSRLFLKRASTFLGPEDHYTLITKESGLGWLNIGTSEERSPLVLSNCLSYDEIKLSALLAVSSPSFFINNGSRHNRGIRGPNGSYIEKGVIVGVVGPRFEVDNRMESEEMLVTDECCVSNGYGVGSSNKHLWRQLWARFYGQDVLPTFTEVKEPKFFKLFHSYFNCDIYVQRIQITSEMLLLEANVKALKANTKAYVHVVGFGLGVWGLWQDQSKYFMCAFAEALRSLDLRHVSDVDFSWIQETHCGDTKDGEVFPGTNVRLHFSKRDPFALLSDEHSGKLLVTSYAWDGNSLPGNEYWLGGLSCSGDPAAACSSQVAELQNAHINKKVSGENLRVVSPKWGLLPLAEFATKMIQEHSSSGISIKENGSGSL